MSAPAFPSAPPSALAPAVDSHQPEARRDDYLFGRGATVRTFALLSLLMVFDFADRMILAALVPALKTQWQISDATAGLLSSVLTLGMVLCAFPAAALIDRWSRIRTASLMGILWSVASAAGALAQSATQLAASRALVGVGEAGYAPAAYAWISAAFPKRRRQLALGAFSAAQPLGMAFGVALGGFIAAHWGWRHALGVIAVPGLIVALLLYRGRDYKNIVPATAAEPTSARIRPLTAVLRTPTLAWVYLAGAMGTLQWVPVVFFLPTYLNRLHGIAPQTASLLTSGILLLSIFAIPAGGWFMDRLNRRDDIAKLVFPLAAATAATTLLGLAFGARLNNVALEYVFALVAVLLASAAGTGPLAVTQELVHPSVRAFSGTCSVVAIHLLGSVPGPVLAGAISDQHGLRFALFSVAVAGGVLQIVALIFATRVYRRDLARVAPAALQAG